MTVASYRVGPPTRPPITHDGGFLDDFAQRKPRWDDYASFAAWAALLEAGEAGQKVPFVPHNHVPDALAAYRHFLYGDGKDRTLSYERYIDEDPSGKKTLESAIAEVMEAAETLYPSVRQPAGHTNFQLTGGAIPCGASVRFPYPKTENWQKAIGAHFIWLSAEMQVLEAPPGAQAQFTAILSLHMEDRYNFNPGATDIATGLPDAANGKFEVTGLAKQYMNYAILLREVNWRAGQKVPASVSSEVSGRVRQPGDNLRVRNRL